MSNPFVEPLLPSENRRGENSDTFSSLHIGIREDKTDALLGDSLRVLFSEGVTECVCV